MMFFSALFVVKKTFCFPFSTILSICSIHQLFKHINFSIILVCAVNNQEYETTQFTLSCELADTKAQFWTSIGQRFSGQGLIQEGSLKSRLSISSSCMYTPSKQAWIPVMLRTTPDKRAVVSLVSTASTIGSTKGNKKMIRKGCVETDIRRWDLEVTGSWRPRLTKKGVFV